MKNLFKIKSSFAGSVRHYGKVMSLIVAFTAFSSGAWADWYFWGYNNNSPQPDSPTVTKKMDNPSTNVYTVTLSASESVGDYYFFISSAGSGSGSSAYNSSIDISSVSGDFYLKKQTGGNLGKSSNTYHFWNDQQKDVTITYNAQNSTLVASSGSGPTPSADVWTLRGGFNSWGSGDVFQDVDGTLTCAVTLPANTTYQKGKDTNGFKIVKTTDGVDTWYGCDAEITTSVVDYIFYSDKDNCGLTTKAAGVYVFTLKPEGNPQLSITYPQAKPQVWVGDEPIVETGIRATVSAYIKSTGCSTVNEIRAYFDKESFDEEPEHYVSSVGTFALSSVTPIVLSANELNKVIVGEGMCHVKFKIHNEGGWSDFSDEVAFHWMGCTSPTAVIDCPGTLESPMVVYPYEPFEMTVEASCFEGAIEWSSTNTSTMGREATFYPVNEEATVVNVKIPRPTGTEGIEFSDITYTIKAQANNSSESATSTCVVILSDITEECPSPNN
ncbi:MAG: hypothetical protein MJ003_01620 [Paludibacteraceae bacterium]|nr:hypothetical protein [Paludibacteraceae bacterium]